MTNSISIASHKGTYTVTFDNKAFSSLNSAVPLRSHFIIDSKVAELFGSELDRVLSSPSVIRVEATESNKTLDKFTGYVEHLVSRNVRRGDVLVAIGGGIIQDITCFLAATLLRGLEWHFFPTTLLAQADSCIGSKSSINVGTAKNLLGTFTPPAKVTISTAVLDTLSEQDILSGVGEMLKVHIIDGPEAFTSIATDYTRILQDRAVMVKYIDRSLKIKQGIIEQDEFDLGIRNIMNYGHSFGHAIESATDFKVPHGIAVTIGMDMANFVSMRMGLMNQDRFESMHGTLAANFRIFKDVSVPLERFLAAIAKDKKNVGEKLKLILVDQAGKVAPIKVENGPLFRELCANYLTQEINR